jgi:hypothetical protein
MLLILLIVVHLMHQEVHQLLLVAPEHPYQLHLPDQVAVEVVVQKELIIVVVTKVKPLEVEELQDIPAKAVAVPDTIMVVQLVQLVDQVAAEAVVVLFMEEVVANGQAVLEVVE